MPKYSIKLIETFAGNGKSLALCDENGKPLPNQTGCVVTSRCDDCVRVSVEFVLGDALPFEP